MLKNKPLSPEQELAANPTENVWVQANAGTGKTTVLVDRLLRILFRAPDVADTGILCLTYTNAGAGEMRNRILSALRLWAMADDADLAGLLTTITTNKPVSADDLTHAREIFYKYIDNPDMLKIKTIHGFCEEILHRFPLEAGISPAWSLVSDAPQRVLLQDAFARLINSPDNDTRVASAFVHIVNRISETGLDDLLDELSARYKDFFKVDNMDNYREYFVDTTKHFLDLVSEKNFDFNRLKLQNILDMATKQQNSSKKPPVYITDIVDLTKQYLDNTIGFEKYKLAYLCKNGSKKTYVEKQDWLREEQDRVYALNQYNSNLEIFADTMALFDLSVAFARCYGDMKRQHNLLDFEDLILYTRKLFLKPDVMGWVLSQLNVSLGHILVDEAQDTNPVQWDILKLLSGDFFADGNTSESPHAMFVVGDTKQSIYSFQGADPRAFANSRAEIASQIQHNMRAIREVPLVQSFRSTPAILKTVDEFFNNQQIKELTGFVNNSHKCVRTDAGLVELHKIVSKQTSDSDVKKYICGIADKIQAVILSGGRKASDIMVLVQKREPLASVLVKELKRRGIDVAGSDRIVLPRFLAIRDLMNLVRFCIDVTDDYSLCCVLKSPLYRLSERDIFDICDLRTKENTVRHHDNPEAESMTVFDALQNTKPEIYTDLLQIVKWSKTLAPYSFFNAVLNHNSVRESMIAALGNQIIDPLEEFMTICLAYERTQPGTMRHFIKWFVTGSSEIKRDMDSVDGVRVVTIHGSKGLEAPVVFLIDTVASTKKEKVAVISKDLLSPSLRAKYDLYPEPWVWIPKDNVSTCLSVVQETNMRQTNAEYYRLLYVAMTRARDELYIYGYTSNTSAPEISWHTQLWNVLSEKPGRMIDGETIRITND